ncbi:MAG TPA: aldose 1-epimerase [Flavihumibacter sp.]
MRFRITHSNQEGIPLVNLHDEETGAIVSIAPEQGAMLHAFIVQSESGPVNIINNYQNIGDIHENLSLSYKSSKLSPFPCRIENGRYEWDGKEYVFANRFPDGSAIHGLLFNKHFTIKEQETTAYFAAILFEYDYQAEDPGYPFAYRCQIRYTLLHDNTLQVQTILQNASDQVIPIADGWHPYFQLGEKVDDCTLRFPSKGMLEFSEKLIPTGAIIPYDNFNTGKRFGDTQLDNCFLVDPTADQPVCELSNPALGLSIRFHTDEHYPYLQLYTPPARKSIAIENLSSAPNCFNNKIGLLTLNPGETINLTLHYSVQTIN